MATIQCKMCGGQVELPDGMTSGECPYCGSVTTFPRLNSEQKEHLYTRAEHFRQKNDFDKAVATYEALLNLDAEDPEVYWGLLISRYGIEYVEDPATHERIPTCHRVQFDSILADSDYLNALKFSSGYDHEIYEKEAQRISEIQKGILRISAQEKPYDVFICYKETTDGGTRTKDSTLAQDIYYQLTNQGLKVFFSRITLENKLGQQYEPYIFAALNSAKVMLVIGSKKEYFEAVWVKNEWSRFLALMKKDRSKLLIPCFKDMDPYDIPEELSMFQSQDMSKIGFMQDILRGIMKIVNAEKVASSNSVAATVFHSGTSSDVVKKMMKRISVLMGQGEWEEAKSNCKDTLKIDPENAELYLLLCMIDQRIPEEKGLWNANSNLQEDKNFKVALKFASPERKKQLEEIQIQTLVNYYLHECMRVKGISNEGDLSCADQPLAEDVFFQKALKVAPPERKKELQQLQYDQVECFLRRCMANYHVFNEADLSHATTGPLVGPLEEDDFFRLALKYASPERRQELLKIQTEQAEFLPEYYLGKCMEQNSASTESELVHIDVPLAESGFFRLALKYASPERRQELLKIQTEQAEFLPEYYLGKCMEAHRVSNEAELAQVEDILIYDESFQKALNYASPTRYQEIVQILQKQFEYFLQKCLENNGVSHECLLTHVPNPLINDSFFQKALVMASPERREVLENIQAEQELELAKKAKKRELIKLLLISGIFITVSLCFVFIAACSITAHDRAKAEALRRAEEAQRAEEEQKAEEERRIEKKWKTEWAHLSNTGMNQFVSSGLINLPFGIKLQMVKVEAGKFIMGSEYKEEHHDEKQHEVTIENDFYIGQTEVTKEQWEVVMNSRYLSLVADSSWESINNLPRDQITWYDAEEFCKKLNDLFAGKMPVGYHFDLPTEAQWEYAARGGNKSRGYKYSGGNLIEEVAWYRYNSRDKTHPVGTKQPNELGLYDMSGNAAEWCQGWYWYEYSYGRQKSSHRVHRGGGCYDEGKKCRVVSRDEANPELWNRGPGFRLALVPAQ